MRVRPPCQHPGCDRQRRKGTLCATHEWRRARGTDMDAPVAPRRKRGQERRCDIPGCTRLGAAIHEGGYICTSHEGRRKRGMPDWRERPMPPMRGRSKHQKADGLVVFTVRLTKAEARRLDKLAEARCITRGTAAREAISAWLEAAKHDGKAKGDALFDSAAWARRVDDAWGEA